MVRRGADLRARGVSGFEKHPEGAIFESINPNGAYQSIDTHILRPLLRGVE